MTESEWLLLNNPGEFEAELSLVAQPRKLYLLTAAFYRRVRDLLPNESVRDAVETTEQFTNGRASARDLLEAWTKAESATGEGWWSDYYYGCPCCEGWLEECFATTIHPNAEALLRNPGMLASKAAFRAADLAAEAVPSCERAQRRLDERVHQYAVFQDIVGDYAERSRPAPDRARATAAVRQVLAALAGEACSDALAMAALADALEEAGCDDERLLRHCRRPRPRTSAGAGRSSISAGDQHGCCRRDTTVRLVPGGYGAGEGPERFSAPGVLQQARDRVGSKSSSASPPRRPDGDPCLTRDAPSRLWPFSSRSAPAWPTTRRSPRRRSPARSR